MRGIAIAESQRRRQCGRLERRLDLRPTRALGIQRVLALAVGALATFLSALVQFAAPAHAYTCTSIGSVVNEGTFIYPGQCLSNGSFQLALQSDGNLVQYSGSLALWASGTGGNSVKYAYFQGDGNFVVYATSGAALWNSHTQTYSGLQLKQQSDANVVMYNGSTPLWNTATAATGWHCWSNNSCGQGDWSWNMLGTPPQSPYAANGSLNVLHLTLPNQYGVDRWQVAEGDGCSYNNLNTTQVESGSTQCNSAHVQNYTGQTQGLTATSQTLWNGYYSAIINQLENPYNDNHTQCVYLARAVGSTPWGTGDFEADC